MNHESKVNLLNSVPERRDRNLVGEPHELRDGNPRDGNVVENPVIPCL